MVFEIDPVEDLAAAVDWFVEAVGPRSRRPIDRVTDRQATAEQLERIEHRLAPYVLPAEIRWLWETWQVDGFDAVPPIPLEGPGRALFSWRLLAWEDDGPRALFPIGYASHDHLVVDVTVPPGAPAPVWTSGVGGDLRLEAPSLATLLRSSAERVEAAFLDAPEDGSVGGGDRLQDALEGPELTTMVDRHLAAAGMQRTLLETRDPAGWPARWQTAQTAMTGGAEAPLGRTHSVAEFAASATAPVAGGQRARLHGDLRQLSGGAVGGHQYLMHLSDATGGIDLAVPFDLLPLGWLPGRAVEVSVASRGPIPAPGRRPDIDAARVYQQQVPIVERCAIQEP